jgi:hypothetical protein
MPHDPNGHDSPAGDFLTFLRQHKAWWLVPLLVVAILFALLILLSGTATTPFIYTAH